MTEQRSHTKPRALLTQAGYAAIGAGDALARCVHGLSKQTPERVRTLRRDLPKTVRRELTQLADRGRRLTGQVPAAPEAPRRTTDDTGPS